MIPCNICGFSDHAKVHDCHSVLKDKVAQLSNEVNELNQLLDSRPTVTVEELALIVSLLTKCFLRHIHGKDCYDEDILAKVESERYLEALKLLKDRG